MGGYQHIIWDWNGTLLDDLDVCVDVMNSMLAARSMEPIDIERHREVFDFPVAGYYEALGFDFAAEPFDSLATDYCAVYERRVPECPLHDDVEAVLARLSAANTTQSILSSCEQGALLDAVQNFGLTGHFSHIVGLADRHAKGKVEAGADLMARAAMSRQRTLLIGDTLHDFEVAQALGIDCVLVSSGHHSTGRLEAACESVVESLVDPIARLSVPKP